MSCLDFVSDKSTSSLTKNPGYPDLKAIHTKNYSNNYSFKNSFNLSGLGSPHDNYNNNDSGKGYRCCHFQSSLMNDRNTHSQSES